MRSSHPHRRFRVQVHKLPLHRPPDLTPLQQAVLVSNGWFIPHVLERGVGRYRTVLMFRPVLGSRTEISRIGDIKVCIRVIVSHALRSKVATCCRLHHLELVVLPTLGTLPTTTVRLRPRHLHRAIFGLPLNPRFSANRCGQRRRSARHA